MCVPVWFLGTLCSLSLIALTWVQHASREPEVPDTSHPRVTVEGGNPLQWKFPSFPCIKAEWGECGRVFSQTLEKYDVFKASSPLSNLTEHSYRLKGKKNKA